jgi:hypothetical protein
MLEKSSGRFADQQDSWPAYFRHHSVCSCDQCGSCGLTGEGRCGRVRKARRVPTVEYVMKEQPLPLTLSGCGPALNRQAAAADVAQAVAALSLMAAIVLSLSSKPLQRVDLAVSAAQRRRRVSKMQPGNESN